MSYEQGLKDYLVNVLGVRTVLVTQGVADIVPAQKEGVDTMESPIVVLSHTDLSPEKNQLLQKMLRAIGIESFQITSEPAVGALFSFVLGTEQWDQQSVGLYDYTGGPQTGVPFARLPELQDMLGSSVETTQLKKKAWELLKDVQKFIQA